MSANQEITCVQRVIKGSNSGQICGKPITDPVFEQNKDWYHYGVIYATGPMCYLCRLQRRGKVSKKYKDRIALVRRLMAPPLSNVVMDFDIKDVPTTKKCS